VDIFVARQAIFDRERNVFGYELLFRSSPTNAFDGTDSTQATSQVIAASFFALGIERVAGNKRAFVNFDRELLVNDSAAVLPRRVAAVELLESIVPDAEVLAACKRLKERGYLLVLDDVVSQERIEALAEFADIVKVDFQQTSPAERRKLLRCGRRLGITMLAEKIETPGEYQRAYDMGYDLFQGYFFARPVIIAGREIPAFKVHYLRILQEVSRPELVYERLEELIKQEVSLAYKLLRYINSAAFGWRGPIESVKQALVLLGESESRRWISLVALPALAQDKAEELVVQAAVRARFCESLADWVGLPRRKTDLFFLGMFSVLDAILDRPLEEALRGICLADDVREVLLGKAGKNNRLAGVYRLVGAYEAGEWEELPGAVSDLNLPPGVVFSLYVESVRWADEVFRPCEAEGATDYTPPAPRSSSSCPRGAPEFESRPP
jgi:EAL and modified HD-GYP domain-containing signal transduction protein